MMACVSMFSEISSSEKSVSMVKFTKYIIKSVKGQFE